MPQFAGNCAAGLASGHAVGADPTNFLISENRLYLFYTGSDGAQRMKDDPSMSGRADAAWRKLK